VEDGVANIDEHLNGNPYWKLTPDVPGMAFVWPASKHTWALNEVQRSSSRTPAWRPRGIHQ